GNRYRDDLIDEPATGDGRQGLFLAGQGKLVLLLAGDVVPLRQVFGRHTHSEAPVLLDGLGTGLALGVGVQNLTVAGAIAIPGVAQVIRGGAHALDPAGHDDVRHPKGDGLPGQMNGQHPRGALLVYRVGRDSDGKPSPQSRDTGNVGRVRRLLGLAEDHLVNLGPFDTSPPHSFLDNDGGQLVGGHLHEGAPHASYRRSNGTDHNHVPHMRHSCSPGLQPNGFAVRNWVSRDLVAILAPSYSGVNEYQFRAAFL